MLMKKVTVKTTDGQIHKYNNVILIAHDDALEIQINKDTVVFPRENIIFYSFKR